MFWDTSAIVPLAFPEAASEALSEIASGHPVVAIWWSTPVECCGAAYRRHRAGQLSTSELKAGLDRLRDTTADARIVAPSDVLRTRAEAVIAQHPLRAADALQLAAALTWCEDQPWSQSFVCLDKRLREAARREGFSVLPDGD